MDTIEQSWDTVKEWVGEARGIAWDTCHKIYVLMDDQQMELMGEYGYDPLISADDISADEMYRMVFDWYENSCALRFVHAVQTVKGDPNAGFTDLIPQGWSEDEECEDCGMEGCAGVCNDYDEPEDED